MELSQAEQQTLHQYIQDIEKETSACIGLHVDDYCKGDPYFKAVKIFQEIGFLSRVEQNALLLYVASQDRKYAIVLDKELDAVVPKDEFERIEQSFVSDLEKGDLSQALTSVMEQYAAIFKDNFPIELQ